MQRAPGIPHPLKGAKDKCTTRAQRAARSRRCICCLTIESSHVVPAKAGTHSHRLSLVRRDGRSSSIKSKRRWLWIPARASLGRDDERVRMGFTVIARSEATKQSIFLFCCGHGLLRFARNDERPYPQSSSMPFPWSLRAHNLRKLLTKHRILKVSN